MQHEGSTVEGLIRQEFTHLATPKENSYNEAFHSILEREVIERNEFAIYY
ncbi:hypothetical protein GCM10023091_28160 [Ravibacter arvi]|uniref:Integrase catalytic domain-containing protein n=1 Tax=Ravibacter arvi TaxID=2051041 RepID=A0ABP8M4F9_9BACT